MSQGSEITALRKRLEKAVILGADQKRRAEAAEDKLAAVEAKNSTLSDAINWVLEVNPYRSHGNCTVTMTTEQWEKLREAAREPAKEPATEASNDR